MTWLFIKSPSKPDSPRPRPLCTLQVLCKPCLRFCSRRVTGIIAHPSFITLLWMTFLCSLLLNEVGERVTPLGQAPGVACGITISLPPSPGGPSAQVSRCRAAAMASLHPLSVPPAPGQRLLPGRGRPGEAGQPSGNSPSCGEDNLERGGSSAEFRSPGQLSVPGPLPAAVAAERHPERKTEAGQRLGHTPHRHGGGRGLGGGQRAGAPDGEHDSLPSPAFCKVLCRATSGLGTLLLCLGAQEPPPSWFLAWAEHPPRPYFCCWRQLLAYLWGVSRARVQAEPSLGAPLGLLQGTCGPQGGAGPGPLLTAPSSAALFLQLSVH